MAFEASIFALLFLLVEVNLLETPSQRFAAIDINHYQKSTKIDCYDRKGGAQRCVPDFENVAFNKPIEVSRPEFTCGVGRPAKYCLQTGNVRNHILNKTCAVCDNRVPQQAHPPSLLTDFNDPEKETTWWQSVTMEEGIHKSRVNLTLRLGKAFDITYVHVKFASPRPESFVIYKKTRATDPWTPWQFYSGSCRSTFGLAEKAPIMPANEAMAQCTREFSDISPLTGGNIAFSTLEGRPSAENFEESEVLQNWVTATEIMISLVRLNTFGDQIFGDLRVHRTYFYAIIDIAVGGRCKCNGHANKCVKSTGQGQQQQLVCDCQHNTAGVDCQQCSPFHVDRPWRPATSTEANECLACNCSGLSSRCFFDAALFEATGHGGHCIDCAGNTEGPHCEHCASKHWRRPGEGKCRPCNCDPTGSSSEQCSEEGGQCKCKPGVGGQRCDQCLPGFYAFGVQGCKECQCEGAGTLNGTKCSPLDGRCACKPNVEGARCDRCKPGSFLLAPANPFGCAPCFCFGHSSVCSSADGFYGRNISSTFLDGDDGWTARMSGNGRAKGLELQYDPDEKAISVVQQCERAAYFVAPSKFVGDQRLAYGQNLRFSLRKLRPYAPWSSMDLQLVGANGRVLSLPMGVQGNRAPSNTAQHYTFRIHADPGLQWNPQLREIDFIGILSNLSEIRLRATYAQGDVGFLSHFSLGTASEGLHPEAGIPRHHADWVEKCQCPPPFVGQFCQFCAEGHKRAQAFGGPLVKCVPCQCNGHAQLCHPESGHCQCGHNTAGDTCERCARGFYGNSLAGTADDCKPCDCPEGGPCLQMDDGFLLCTECPEGYTGPRCEYCAEEHFGEPQMGMACQKCNCSGNVDPNAIGQCDPLSGECRRCIHHTTGWHCERCMPGFWGNPLAEPKGDCRPCRCYPAGTQPTGAIDNVPLLECAMDDGQCPCLPNVVGQRCDKCAHGFFNITSGRGCQSCECDPLGSEDVGQCDLHTGQCQCKKGIIGLKCDQCSALHYGFGVGGCAACQCHRDGAELDQCDIHTGQCLCRDWVEGRQCDRCAENHHNLAAHCPACDDCYALIQQRKSAINGTMAELAQQLDDFRALPIPLTNSTALFNKSIEAIFGKIQNLQERANWVQNSTLLEEFGAARDEVKAAFGLLDEAKRAQIGERGLDEELTRIEAKMGKFAKEKVAIERQIGHGLNKIGTDGHAQLERARRLQRGKTKMPALSQMAAEASQLAKKQEEMAAEIRGMAEAIGATSGMALAEAEETVSSSREPKSSVYVELDKLRYGADATLRELAVSIKSAKDVRKLADHANNQSALLLANSERIVVPKLMAAKGPDGVEAQGNLSASLAELTKEIGRIGRELEENRAKGVEMEAMAQAEVTQVRKALEEAERRWKAAEAEYVLASRLEENAIEAGKSVEEAYAETEAMLEALDGQDASKLDELKEEYEEEVGHSRALGKNLAKTERRLERAERGLAKVQKMADKALKMALEAEEGADLMAKSLHGLDEKAEKLYSRLDALSTELAELEEAIRVEEQLNGERIKHIVGDERKRKEVFREAATDEQLALSLQSISEKNEKMLMALLERMNTISPPDDAELDLLEVKLVQVEKVYAESEFERTEQRVRQSIEETSQMREQIAHLQEELKQLDNIAQSLPTKCFNVVKIEQNGQ